MPRNDERRRHEEAAGFMLLGAAVAGAVYAGANWLAGTWSSQREAVPEEAGHMPGPAPGGDTLRLRVGGRNASVDILDAHDRPILRVSSEVSAIRGAQIRRVAAWRCISGDDGVMLLYQRRSGDWATWATTDAPHLLPKPLSTVVMSAGRELVDVLSPPPARYTPTRSDGGPECCICTTNAPDTQVLPCAHLSLCFECTEQYLSRGTPECPICRTRITAISYNFLA